jgi:hypothetical protein
VRDWVRPWDQSRWESLVTAFDDVPSMPVVRWDAQAPVTQMLSLHQDHREPAVAVSLFNPAAQPLPVKVWLIDAWHMNPPMEHEETLTLAPGETKAVTLKAVDQGPEGDHHTQIRVTAPDGQRLFFTRDVRWNLHRPADVWTIEKEQRQAVDLQFKHYPYHRLLQAKVDVSSLSVRDRITAVRVGVRPQGRDTVLAEQRFPFKDAVAEGAFAVPELADGSYEVAAWLEGGDGVPREPVVQGFERRHFPWEHNRLGLSEVVIPPFTPLQATGDQVSCVLRTHRLNGVGLWDQVTSEGTELLAAPLRWEVVAHGGPVAVTPAGVQVETALPHRVVTRGGWTAGTLRAEVRAEYDIDGMTKILLTVAETADPPTRLERLSLVVPLRQEVVRYLHTCGDGLRYNYAGTVPAGEGVIWDSSTGNKTNVVGTFYPYVYVGGAARGLCWFADSDRDWILDDQTPTVQLVRQDGRGELRVHLVTRAGWKATSPRRSRTPISGSHTWPTSTTRRTRPPRSPAPRAPR